MRECVDLIRAFVPCASARKRPHRFLLPLCFVLPESFANLMTMCARSGDVPLVGSVDILHLLKTSVNSGKRA